MACLLKNEPASYTFAARLRQGAAGAGGKPSLKRAGLRKGTELRGVDPKPCELPMARLQVG